MAARDDLNGPLGLGGPRGPRRRPLPYRLVFFVAAALLLLGGIAYLERYGDPLGGEPHAVARITPPATRKLAQASAAARTNQVRVDDMPTGTIPTLPGDDTAAEIERKSGVKIIRNGDAKAPGALIIDVPEVLAQKLAPAPDPRLVEKSRYGLLPHVGRDGARAADVYARPWPVGPAPTPNMPRIALVVGGLGLSESATAEAISDLPGAVTLAFAPYGKDLKEEASRARSAGHEVILQLPMEPIDYPQTNPGPHTLLVSASVAQNADNLHWLMSRFTGYTGVANFLGAKFTDTADRFRPVLREIADRGLFYVDDGSSAQSIGLPLAQEIGLPAARVDLIVDAAGTPASVDDNLAALEGIARRKGLAIGMASDLPTSLEKVAHFAKLAASHGIMLVPLSAAVRKAQEMRMQDAARFRDP